MAPRRSARRLIAPRRPALGDDGAQFALVEHVTGRRPAEHEPHRDPRPAAAASSAAMTAGLGAHR